MKPFLLQMLRIWRELGLNQKITLGASALAVLGGMLALLFWAQRPDMKLLYGRLGDKEAAEVVSALQTLNIPFELGAGGTSVYVASNQVYKVRMDLAAKGLPSADGVGFEIFDRSNFGISDFVQRTNYSRALQGELGRTIAQLKGVRSARVMVVLPENRLLLKSTESRPTASVFIDTGGLTFDSSSVNSIRSLVANAVEGMRLDDVAVVDSRGNVLSEELKSDPQLGTASSQIKFRRQTEEYLASKVETMLAKVLGPGQAVVRVSTEINNESTTVTQEKFDPESQVARSETTTEDSSLTSEKDAEKAGAAGVSSNVPGDQNPAATAGSPTKSTEDQRKSKTQSYEISRSLTNVVKNPGAITRVTAAVFLATKAAPAGGTATARTADELTALRQMVVNALGIQAANAQGQAAVVSIQEVEFPTIAEPSPMSPEKLTGYAEMLRPAVALFLAAVFFFIFLQLFKKTKPEQITFEIIDESAPESPTQQLPAMKNHKVSPELLNDLIRQKPENVGATLRDWLANSGGN